MKRNKLDKLQRELAQMRRSPQRTKDLESLAGKLGRKQHKGGKHPPWVNEVFTDLRPLSIPNHPGDLTPGTKNSILNQLEDDLCAWEEWLENEKIQ